MTSYIKPIMTVPWPAISNQSDSDSHLSRKSGPPFAQPALMGTLYSVQELLNCLTWSCCLTMTLQIGRLYMEYDMDFALDDDRWQKICCSYEIPFKNQ